MMAILRHTENVSSSKDLVKLLVNYIQMRVLRLVRRQCGDEHVLSCVGRRSADTNADADAQRCSRRAAGQSVRRRCTRVKSASLVVSLPNKNVISYHSFNNLGIASN